MAGTMPHAIFIETNWDGQGGVAAYAAELPGCAAFAATDDEASATIPSRAAAFTGWLRREGEEVHEILGDNWYEVERATASDDRRASFSLDELPPSDEEFARWTRWLELAREELADALDAAGEQVLSEALPLLDGIDRQDRQLVAELGGGVGDGDDPIGRLYGSRDALMAQLERVGASHDGVRRILRLAIADDLRVADALRGGADR